MTADPIRFTWRAGRDGEAHAHRPGHPRTLCGLPVIGESLTWPESERCRACVHAVLSEMDGRAAR